ncbi:hypothetical protein RSOLAG22IIIB_05181 [Rhizoctonia solani]|uniref:Uncharacterized protein n=1 Tax=Rhizoctonia solani TaxID=456999 RepID=A0A0K6G3S9_9AGAM|nr:hypothetical protein RSOLAG22IIIB_05181 [Rhizoctonia solani]
MSTFRNLAGLYVQLPRHTFDPLKTFLTSPSFDEYLVEQYGKLVDQWYFRPTDVPKRVSQSCLVLILQTSVASFSRWIALIGLGLCEAFVRGDPSHNRLHTLWMEYIGNSLKRELSDDLTRGEVQSRRRDWIHVSLLRTLVVQNSDVYQVLRSITPTFLQSVYSRPELWPTGSNPGCVPLLSVLTIGSHELAYFALIDCTFAMAFGLPHLVEYDTTVYPSPRSSLSHQWAHGAPTEFQVVLAQINACRDQSPAAPDWRDVERWLLEWQSRPGEHTFSESWMMVAWYAVQESWRLALLVYLHLAVCGVPSDDQRIQSYVKQMLQVIGTVRPRESEDNIFFIHYLVVGICARSEAHRTVVRDKLSAHKGTRFWLHCVTDFVLVLDHLWHGAGADGRPVGWSDYMGSRELVLPVVV